MGPASTKSQVQKKVTTTSISTLIVAGAAGTASTVVVIVGTIHSTIKKTANRMLLLDRITTCRGHQERLYMT